MFICSNIQKDVVRFRSNSCSKIKQNDKNQLTISKTPSLPSLVTNWTCIRCLLDNKVSAASTCAACGANSSIAKTQISQIGVRKCRRLNSKPKTVTKLASGSIAQVLNTNSVKISIGIGNKEGNIFLCFMIV